MSAQVSTYLQTAKAKLGPATDYAKVTMNQGLKATQTLMTQYPPLKVTSIK